MKMAQTYFSQSNGISVYQSVFGTFLFNIVLLSTNINVSNFFTMLMFQCYRFPINKRLTVYKYINSGTCTMQYMHYASLDTYKVPNLAIIKQLFILTYL